MKSGGAFTVLALTAGVWIALSGGASARTAFEDARLPSIEIAADAGARADPEALTVQPIARAKGERPDPESVHAERPPAERPRARRTPIPDGALMRSRRVL